MSHLEGYLRRPWEHNRDKWEDAPPENLLIKHPIARRSFATFAPLPRLRLVMFGNKRPPMDVSNPNGITVWDVYSALYGQ